MSDFETSGKQVTGIVLIGLGAMLSIIGAFSLIGGAGEIWYILLLLLLSGLLLLYSGISNLQQAKVEKQKEKQIIQMSITDKALGMSPNEEIETIAMWSVDGNYWNKFSMMEKRTRKFEQIGILLGMVVLGTLFLIFKKGASFYMAVMINILVFLMYLLLSRTKSSSYLTTSKKEIRCIFLEKSAIINEQVYALWNDNKWMSNVELKRENEILFLEITLNWNTRSGEAHDEIRVPYYAQDAEKATLVCNYYYSKIRR